MTCCLSRKMAYPLQYNWNNEFLQLLSHQSLNKKDKFLPTGLSAIKSCIEADEPTLLSELIKRNTHAMIYSLILCFTIIPSTKCIEYLVSIGTPLHETFPNNPFNVSPMEYLDTVFSTSVKGYLKCRNRIDMAIKKGKNAIRKQSFEDHTIIYMS